MYSALLLLNVCLIMNTCMFVCVCHINVLSRIRHGRRNGLQNQMWGQQLWTIEFKVQKYRPI